MSVPRCPLIGSPHTPRPIQRLLKSFLGVLDLGARRVAAARSLGACIMAFEFRADIVTVAPSSCCVSSDTKYHSKRRRGDPIGDNFLFAYSWEKRRTSKLQYRVKV